MIGDANPTSKTRYFHKLFELVYLNDQNFNLSKINQNLRRILEQKKFLALQKALALIIGFAHVQSPLSANDLVFPPSENSIRMKKRYGVTNQTCNIQHMDHTRLPENQTKLLVILVFC